MGHELSAFFFLNGIALSWFHLSAESAAMAMQVMRWFNVISLFIWPASFTLPTSSAQRVTPPSP